MAKERTRTDLGKSSFLKCPAKDEIKKIKKYELRPLKT